MALLTLSVLACTGLLMIWNHRATRQWLESLQSVPESELTPLRQATGTARVNFVFAPKCHTLKIFPFGDMPYITLNPRLLFSLEMMTPSLVHEMGHVELHQRVITLSLMFVGLASPWLALIWGVWCLAPQNIGEALLGGVIMFHPILFPATFLLGKLKLAVAHWQEYDADLFAAQRVGFRRYRRALLHAVLSEPDSRPPFKSVLQQDLETHPSIVRRLYRLRQYAYAGKIPW